jgi:hypothetical protein
VEYLNVVCIGDISAGRRVVFGVGIWVGLLEKVFADEVGEVWMADLMTEAMEAVWVFGSY